VDCALMATGFYPQKEQNGWRYQFGTSSRRNFIAWQDLFHKSRNDGYERTHEILISLLSGLENITDEALDQIAQKYIEVCEQSQVYPIQYYYIKYSDFRPGRYGKYGISMHEPEGTYYHISVMVTQTKYSEYTYIPYFKIADPDHVSKDEHGQKLVYPNAYIGCSNSSYEVRKNEGNELLLKIDIAQNESGYDTEDRILKLINYLSNKPEVLFCLEEP